MSPQPILTKTLSSTGFSYRDSDYNLLCGFLSNQIDDVVRKLVVYVSPQLV